MCRPISAVHESVTADRVLRHMRERRSHQAIVVDEFGGTSGVITLQNVLAEFLGEVGDEFKADDPKAEEIVRRAYHSVLGREPDAGARGYVNRVLRDKWTQQDVERELRRSAEYRQR